MIMSAPVTHTPNAPVQPVARSDGLSVFFRHGMLSFLQVYPALTAAAKTINGKGTFSAKMATKLAAEMAKSKLFFKAREPMRCAACTTMAVTAGLMP